MNVDCDSISALKKAVAAGMLSVPEVTQRLSVAIEAEYMKDQPRMDFINACEDLLREIHTDGTLPFVSRVKDNEAFIQSRTKVRTYPSFPVWLKGCAVAAALLLIAVFGVHHGRIAWMIGETIDEGERYLIKGHEINLEVIQKAIAAHGETEVQTESLDEVVDLLGFTPLLPDMSAMNVKKTSYYLIISEGYIILDVLYQRDPTALNVVCSISWYTDEEEAYLTVQQSGEGVTERIAGTDVYCYMNINRPGFIWSDGLTLYTISGGWTQEEGRTIVSKMLAEKP